MGPVVKMGKAGERAVIHIPLHLKTGSVEQPMRVFDRLEEGVGTAGVYLLCYDKNSPHLMEIIQTTQLCGPYCQSKTYYAVALANGKREAFAMAADIMGSIFQRIPEYKGPEQVYKALEQEGTRKG